MTKLDVLLEDASIRSKGRLQGSSGNWLEASELAARAQLTAGLLGDMGVCANELVLVFVNNEPNDIVSYMAVWKAGAVAVPIHATSPETTISAMHRRTGARFVIVNGIVEQWGTDPAPARSELAGAAIIVFTSGSTGKPKGVIVGHDALSFKLDVLSKLLGFSSSDTILMPLQLTFIFGIWVTLLGLLSGSKVILVPKFSVEVAAALLPLATILAAVPTMLRSISAEKIESPQLEKILTGGEPLSPSLAASLKSLSASAAIYDLYGLTETGSCDFCLTPSDQPHGLGTIGRPTARVEYRIATVADTVEGAGELQMKTPSIMLGYLDDPALTESAFDRSYFKSGDLARLRDDGLVELIGRSKDIISRGGNKIAPLEIDHLLAQHPDVVSAMSVGIADRRLGEALHVLVVKRAGCDATEEAIREWCRGRVEKYKLPDAIHFCDGLPLGSTGKADRKAAAAFLAERL